MTVDELVDRVAGLGVPDHILELVRGAADDTLRDGGQAALDQLGGQVEAVARCIDVGDVPGAIEAAGEWGAMLPLLMAGG